MVTLRSARYPGLILADLGVRFVDGLLVTDDPRVVARARRLRHLGVVVDDADQQPERVERRDPPRRNASRAAWADFAAHVGVVVGESWKRDRIRDEALKVVDDAV